jgi:hypothetical protein
MVKYIKREREGHREPVPTLQYQYRSFQIYVSVIPGHLKRLQIRALVSPLICVIHNQCCGSGSRSVSESGMDPDARGQK